MLAARSDLPTVIWLVNKGGASVLDRNEHGGSALLVAAICGQVKIVRWLVEVGGASMTDVDNQGNSALLLAALRGHMTTVQYCLEFGGSSCSERNTRGESVWDLLKNDLLLGRDYLERDVVHDPEAVIALLKVMVIAPGG
jgi:ankyrin repeat protein